MKIQSLKGRTAIECVQFSRNEEVLATGSLKGSLQIWDLNSKNCKFLFLKFL